MIEAKRFSGILNTDDKPENVVSTQHIDANNVRFYGGPNGMTLENIKGNYVIPNATLPDGTNVCIGSFFDSVNQRIIWFNYNSNGDNGIYKIDLKTDVISPIFICGTDSATDILNFDVDYPVHSASLIYRTIGDGDLLYWTDGYNRPKYLNIDTVSSLAPFTGDMITAAKNAPLIPPVCSYHDNLNVNSNNLRKKLFRFCYRWVYKNGEKSTFSPISSLPLPVNGYDQTLQNNPGYNNNISILMHSGGDDYKAIEVAGQININNTWSDFFLIDTLDRTEYGISPNSTYTYYFYNSSSYNSIDPEETDLYFSWLPNKANTLEALNGNVIIYGGITNGYNNLLRSEVDVTVTTGVAPGQSTNQPSISVTTILGPGGNPDGASLQFTIGSVIVSGAIYHIEFTAEYRYPLAAPPTIINKNINYTTTPSDTQNSIVTNVIAALYNPLEPLVYTDNGNGVFTVSILPSQYRRYMYNAVVYVTNTDSASAQSAWKWDYSGRLGLVYFDEFGKTNGVVSFVSDNVLDNTDFAFTTSKFTTLSSVPQIPFVSATINHTPPIWAKTYQWVRSNNLPSNFLQYVTCQFSDPSDGFLYFCIQNLLYQKNVDSGFVPSYEFTPGDRIRVMGSFLLGNFTSYTDQLDFEIIGTVDNKFMSGPNPSTVGTWIKVVKPVSFPAYTRMSFVELYTPRLTEKNNQTFFYEWGEEYAIYETGGNRYHRGQIQDQTATQPATFTWFNGNVYYRPRRFYTIVNNANSDVELMMEASYSDYFVSTVNSDGRVWVIDENAKEEYNPILVRWGGKYQSGTNINNLPIFRPNDFDEVDRSKGAIRRFKTRDRILRVFQDRGTGQYGVYARFIQNNNGQSELVTTNDIITTNNIQYYQGVYGVSGYPTNLVSTQHSDYFADVVTGRAIRLGGDGLTDLGLTYKGQFYLSQLVTPYNKTLITQSGTKSKVMGLFDYFNNQYHVILEGSGSNGIEFLQENLDTTYNLYLWGTPFPGDVVIIDLQDNSSHSDQVSYTVQLGDTIDDILNGLVALVNNTTYFQAVYSPTSPHASIVVTSTTLEEYIVGNVTIEFAPGYSPKNFSFNDTRKGFCSFYDFHPEWAMGANDMIYTWKEGELWKHDDPTYCNFYGDQYNASATFVFNNNLIQKKSWNSINEVASGVWEVPSMYTNSYSYGTQVQQSNIVDAEFTLLEGNPSSAIKRDANSPGGKINGNFMKGNYLVAKFEKQNASDYITLSELSVRYTDSPLTAK